MKTLACSAITLAGVCLSATVSQAQSCGQEVVFDFSPMVPPGVGGEFFNITTLQGEIVHARVDATFISNEEAEWSIFANFEFPTGITGVDSQTGGWKGVGRFSTSFETDALNGILVPPSGSPFVTWFLTYAGGTPSELPGGGIALGPMDGYFETLTLTVTLATCPVGDLTGDYLVDGADLGLLLSDWGTCRRGGCASDLNDDGVIDGADLGLLLSNWGNHWCPPPYC